MRAIGIGSRIMSVMFLILLATAGCGVKPPGTVKGTVQKEAQGGLSGVAPGSHNGTAPAKPTEGIHDQAVAWPNEEQLKKVSWPYPIVEIPHAGLESITESGDILYLTWKDGRPADLYLYDVRKGTRRRLMADTMRPGRVQTFFRICGRWLLWMEVPERPHPEVSDWRLLAKPLEGGEVFEVARNHRKGRGEAPIPGYDCEGDRLVWSRWDEDDEKSVTSIRLYDLSQRKEVAVLQKEVGRYRGIGNPQISGDFVAWSRTWHDDTVNFPRSDVEVYSLKTGRIIRVTNDGKHWLGLDEGFTWPYLVMNYKWNGPGPLQEMVFGVVELYDLRTGKILRVSRPRTPAENGVDTVSDSYPNVGDRFMTWYVSAPVIYAYDLQSKVIRIVEQLAPGVTPLWINMRRKTIAWQLPPVGNAGMRIRYTVIDE